MAKAKKQAVKAAAPAPKEDPLEFTVTRPLVEDGERYEPGDPITLPPERAAALGDLVEPASI